MRENAHDRPVLQVEITPQMIQAGFAVLEASGIADEYLEVDKLTVEEIFRAMYLRLLDHDPLSH